MEHPHGRSTDPAGPSGAGIPLLAPDLPQAPGPPTRDPGTPGDAGLAWGLKMEHERSLDWLFSKRSHWLSNDLVGEGLTYEAMKGCFQPVRSSMNFEKPPIKPPKSLHEGGDRPLGIPAGREVQVPSAKSRRITGPGWRVNDYTPYATNRGQKWRKAGPFERWQLLIQI